MPTRDLIFPAARYHTAAGRVLAEGGVRSPSYHQFAIDLAASELRGMLNFASLRLTGVLPPARAAADPTGEVTCLLIDGHRFLREYCRTPGAVRVRRVLGTLEPKILLEARSAADAFERAAASARRREMLAAARDAAEKTAGGSACRARGWGRRGSRPRPPSRGTSVSCPVRSSPRRPRRGRRRPQPGV